MPGNCLVCHSGGPRIGVRDRRRSPVFLAIFWIPGQARNDRKGNFLKVSLGHFSEFISGSDSTNAPRTLLKASGSSSITMCPASSMNDKTAPGI